MPKTKSFIVAVAGDTVDGRVIEDQWLKDIAATYDPKTYTAVVNKEHIRGLSGGEPFKAYGKVLSTSTSTIALSIGGKTVNRLALSAEIEASDELVAMTADGQKTFTSIEVAPNFANSGKANLVGLAVTDTPASLGTEVLTFALQHPGAMSMGPRVAATGNVFTPGREATIELADGETATPPADSAAGMFAAATAFFKNLGKPAVAEPAKTEPEPAPAKKDAANDNDARFATLISGMEQLTSGIGKLGIELRTEIGKVRTAHDELKAQVETTAKTNTFARGPASGGVQAAVTDC